LKPLFPVIWILLGVFLCRLVTAQDASWREFPGGRWQALAGAGSGSVGFTALSPAETGVAFTNTLRDADGALNRTLYNGSGVAAGDFDGDGRPDVVFAGIEGQLRLFRNLGGWRFADVTAGSGVVGANFMGRGVVLADVTGDGALDLLLTANGAGVRCWRNDGAGHFTDVTEAAGTGHRDGSLSLALADVDGDGTVDLYVANNRTDDIRDRGQVQLRLVNGRPAVPDPLTNRLVLIDGRLFEHGEPDRLLLNDGTGKFRERAWTDGSFKDEAGVALSGPPRDWGLGATFRDLNGDGSPDLYVCNDFWTPDRIWLNDGRGGFRAGPATAFRHTSGSSMGVDMADLNGDGRPEIFVVDMLSRSLAWRQRQMPAQEADLAGANDRPQVLRNTLFLARDDGTYVEIAEFAGLEASEWAWQPVFLDADLDGRPDLLITSGHARDVQDRDAAAIVNARQRNYSAIADLQRRRMAFTLDLYSNMLAYPVLKTPVVAFRNLGGLRFEDATDAWGTGELGIHHGIATADFDGDGDLDFAVNRLNSAAGIYRNNVVASRVALRLRGRGPNHQAICAIVTVRGEGLPEQRHEVVVGGRYLSGGDPLLVFAASPTNGVQVRIRWRSGQVSELGDVQAGRLYEVFEERTAVAAGPEPMSGPRPATWFEDVSERLDHHHVDEPFDDFAQQPLLPRRVSSSGPGVAWADLDDDGDDDLVIGAGKGGKMAMYRNDAGQFHSWTGWVSDIQTRDVRGLLAVPAGTNSWMLAARSAWEDGRTNLSGLMVMSRGKPAPELPGLSSHGALSMADYDGDGDVDLFAGGGPISGSWPDSSPSVLVRRTPSGWELDATNTAALAGVGLVNGAVWTDIDGDGWADLALACEWGPVRVFRNARGRLSEITAELGLAEATGWWTGISAGDFDRDGRMDLVAMNWGENSQYRVRKGQPIELHFGRWPGIGATALIETAWDAGRLRPLRNLDELVASLPWLSDRFASVHAYSEAGLDEVLRGAPSPTQVMRATVLSSVVLLNRGGRFESRRLPDGVQFAPAFGVSVSDFDLDGSEDLFIAQGFFGIRPGTARLDAGTGCLLRGDGHGGFAAVPASESGIRCFGEGRACAVADFDQDGRPDLVVTQNSGATRLFRNRSAAHGHRIRVVGPTGNPDSIGAVVRVRGLALNRELGRGSGFLSQDSAVIAVAAKGVGDAMVAEVRWPDGATWTGPLKRRGEDWVVRHPEAR
jgi:enediyne biosynthesis protein E4